MPEAPLPLVLLLSSDKDWEAVVRQALHGIAMVRRVASERALQLFLVANKIPVHLVLVDAAGFADQNKLMDFVQQWKPGFKLVVVASVPSWRDARDLLLLGACDYIRKSEGVEEIRGQLIRWIGTGRI